MVEAQKKDMLNRTNNMGQIDFYCKDISDNDFLLLRHQMFTFLFRLDSVRYCHVLCISGSLLLCKPVPGLRGVCSVAQGTVYIWTSLKYVVTAFIVNSSS